MCTSKSGDPGGETLAVCRQILEESMSGFGTTPLRFRDDVGTIAPAYEGPTWRPGSGHPLRDLDEKPGLDEL